MKTFKILITLLFIGFVSTSAQSEETKDKLINLEGDATKIIIETENGEIEITGDDAKLLFKKIKSKKTIMIKNFISSDLGKDENVIFFEKGEHSSNSEISIDVDIKDTDGEKVVIVKKIVDGKETVKEYKGDEATEFLDEHSHGEKTNGLISDEGEVYIMMEMGGDDLKWITDSAKNGITKEIDIKDNDGVKIVTVTTTENENKNVEVYEGDEAEEYLEKMEQCKKIEFNISKDGDSKIIKRNTIIIKEEYDSDAE